MTATKTSSGTVTSTTNSAWDSVTSGSIPLNIDDATTTSSGTTNASYIYGDLLSGGTAPVEQITTTGSGSTAVFLVANQTGVQGVYGSTGSSLEQALYSVYGKQTLVSGSDVTPFGFQGSYTDSTGLIYLINRYYDSTTDEFMSIDPEVATTDQPYVFTNDDPLNEEDPLGLTPEADGEMFNELEAPDPDGWAGETEPEEGNSGGNVGSKENNNDTKIKATELKVTDTIQQEMEKYVKDGARIDRTYQRSVLTIQNIIDSGDPVADPGGAPDSVRWDVRGYNESDNEGTYELVVNLKTMTILHFGFVGK